MENIFLFVFSGKEKGKYSNRQIFRLKFFQ